MAMNTHEHHSLLSLNAVARAYMTQELLAGDDLTSLDEAQRFEFKRDVTRLAGVLRDVVESSWLGEDGEEPTIFEATRGRPFDPAIRRSPRWRAEPTASGRSTERLRDSPCAWKMQPPGISASGQRAPRYDRGTGPNARSRETSTGSAVSGVCPHGKGSVEFDVDQAVKASVCDDVLGGAATRAPFAPVTVEFSCAAA
jgi:hypothetical protein